jgi:5-methylcytosine-specific restriction protein A
MPPRAPRECSKGGCRTLTKTRYCEEHAVVVQQERKRVLDRDRQGDPFRALYNTARWKRIRLQVLYRNPLCAVLDCNQPSYIADHIVTARQWVSQGQDFYDETNLQGLCKLHHDAKTAKETEGFARRKRDYT